MNDILVSMAFSAITVGGLWVLLKDTLIESVGKTISYKFDKKLQDNQKSIDIEIKLIESRLVSNGAQVESLINNNLLALDFRRQKQIEVIEVIWIEMMQLRQLIPGFVFTLESMPSEFHEDLIRIMDLKKIIEEFSLDEYNNLFKQSQVRAARLFSGELLYSYYGLYQSIVAICLMNISVEGLEGSFSNWYEKYDVMTVFTNPLININEVEGKLGKTQKILDLIEMNFLSDSEKIINGEVQMYEGNERAKQINEMKSQLNESAQNLA